LDGFDNYKHNIIDKDKCCTTAPSKHTARASRCGGPLHFIVLNFMCCGEAEFYII